MEPGDFRLKPKKYAPLIPEQVNTEQLPLDLLNILFRTGPTMFPYTSRPQIRGMLSKSLAQTSSHSLLPGSLDVGRLERVQR